MYAIDTFYSLKIAFLQHIVSCMCVVKRVRQKNGWIDALINVTRKEFALSKYRFLLILFNKHNLHSKLISLLEWMSMAPRLFRTSWRVNVLVIIKKHEVKSH